MELRKYKVPLILIMVVALSFTLALGIALRHEKPYFKTLPFDNGGADIAFFTCMIILASILGGVFSGYIFGPLFLFLHKKIIGRKMIYGIQERPEPSKFKGNLKAIFPSLMAINFSFMFSSDPQIIQMLIYSEISAFAPLMAFLFILMITMGISMAIFSPVWFLLDAGIVYTNKKRVEDRREPIEIRSVGGWYHYALKGYTGISVIFTYFLFLISIFNYYGAKVHISIPIFLIPFPILLSILALPTILILEFNIHHRKEYILKFAKRLGIIGPLEDPLDIKEK